MRMKLSRAEMDAEEQLHLEVLGWCVKQRRLARHLTQDELADLAHISRGEVQHVEHARHGMREGTKKRLCVAFGISIIELDAEVDRVTQEWKQNGRQMACGEASITGGEARSLL